MFTVSIALSTVKLEFGMSVTAHKTLVGLLASCITTVRGGIDIGEVAPDEQGGQLLDESPTFWDAARLCAGVVYFAMSFCNFVCDTR